MQRHRDPAERRPRVHFDLVAPVEGAGRVLPGLAQLDAGARAAQVERRRRRRVRAEAGARGEQRRQPARGGHRHSTREGRNGGETDVKRNVVLVVFLGGFFLRHS